MNSLTKQGQVICVICEKKEADKHLVDTCVECDKYYSQEFEDTYYEWLQDYGRTCGFCQKELHTPKDKQYGIHAKCEDAAIAAYEAAEEERSME